MSPLLPLLAMTHSPCSREDPTVPSASQLIPTSLSLTPSAQPSSHQHPLSTQRHLAAPTPLWGHSNSLCLDTQCRTISAHSSGPVMGEGQFRGSHQLPKPHPRDGTCRYPLFSVPKSGEGSTYPPLLCRLKPSPPSRFHLELI